MIRVLVLVHGMGVQGTDWASGAMASLTSAAESYGLGGVLGDTMADGRVAVVPVRYDDRFAAELARWGSDSRVLAGFIRQNAIDVPANLVTWLERADATENNFLWSHVVDVLLYRYFNLVASDVRVHVATQVARAWKAALELDPDAQVSVLAHSLGTSVTHDSLGLLATTPPPGADGFLAGDRRLRALFMVANVSRILETLPAVYDSVMCPPSVRGPRAYCSLMCNVRHELDPFPAPRAFDPPWRGRDFARVRTTAVREFNVHSLERYLDDPRVHVALFRALLGASVIDDATARARIASYDAAPGPPCPQALATFATSCRQRIQLIEDAVDVKSLVAAGVHFLADVEEARAQCRGG